MMSRRQALIWAGSSAAGAALPFASWAAENIVRLTSVRFGTVSWLIETIRSEGLDRKHGFTLKVVEVASNAAAPIALLAGEADVVVSDWTWAMRQRAKGLDFKFASYSSALGSVMVPEASAIKSLADLEGKKIGVAGSSIDKSWVLLRAYSRKVLGQDIGKIAEPVFGAAPLITEEFRRGRVDACLNFWTYAARLEAGGARQILSMADIIRAMDIKPTPSLVGFIWSESGARAKGLPIDKLLAAANEANLVLAKSDEAWERLRTLVKPATDKEFASIKSYFRSGITGPWGDAETAAAEKLTNLLLEFGDTELVGNGTRFDPNLFHAQAG
jgi:NitT/TauT family transport system substrate-binding protein